MHSVLGLVRELKHDDHYGLKRATINHDSHDERING